MQEIGTLGTHLIIDIWVDEPQVLDDINQLETILLTAAERGNLTVLGCNLHKFEPQGVTGVVVLSASHMSIHTWPEHKYAALDIFTCDGNPWAALAYLKEHLHVEEIRVHELARGDLGADGTRASSYVERAARPAL